jgi:hypothetical protein
MPFGPRTTEDAKHVVLGRGESMFLQHERAGVHQLIRRADDAEVGLLFQTAKRDRLLDLGLE